MAYQVENTLSDKDSLVLNSIFNPEDTSVPLPSVKFSSNPSSISDIDQLAIAEEMEIARLLSEDSTSLSTVRYALERLDRLLENHRSYPSVYVNRAQARRLLVGNELFSAGKLSDLSAILKDLSCAINFASPPSITSAVTSRQARTLAVAHTHRAYLLYKIAKLDDVNTLLDALQSLGKESLEEMASRDFLLGGRYGDTVARQMSVHTNPYAKLCGAIVKEALKKEIADGGHQDHMKVGNYGS